MSSPTVRLCKIICRFSLSVLGLEPFPRRKLWQHRQLLDSQKNRIVGLREGNSLKKKTDRQPPCRKIRVARCSHKSITGDTAYHRRGAGRHRTMNEFEDRAIIRAVISSEVTPLSSI